MSFRPLISTVLLTVLVACGGAPSSLARVPKASTSSPPAVPAADPRVEAQHALEQLRQRPHESDAASTERVVSAIEGGELDAAERGEALSLLSAIDERREIAGQVALLRRFASQPGFEVPRPDGAVLEAEVARAAARLSERGAFDQRDAVFSAVARFESARGGEEASQLLDAVLDAFADPSLRPAIVQLVDGAAIVAPTEDHGSRTLARSRAWRLERAVRLLGRVGRGDDVPRILGASAALGLDAVGPLMALGREASPRLLETLATGEEPAPPPTDGRPPSASVTTIAADALARMGVETAVPMLLDRLRTTRSPSFALTLVGALAQLPLDDAAIASIGSRYVQLARELRDAKGDGMFDDPVASLLWGLPLDARLIPTILDAYVPMKKRTPLEWDGRKSATLRFLRRTVVPRYLPKARAFVARHADARERADYMAVERVVAKCERRVRCYADVIREAVAKPYPHATEELVRAVKEVGDLGSADDLDVLGLVLTTAFYDGSTTGVDDAVIALATRTGAFEPIIAMLQKLEGPYGKIPTNTLQDQLRARAALRAK